MNLFETSNPELKRRNFVESREIRDKEPDEQEKKAAAMERVEQVSKEVRNTKKQLQNIMANMAQVVKAVQAIRAQLQLVGNDKIPSVERDQKNVEILQNKLKDLRGELKDLRVALITELKKDIAQARGVDSAELETEAKKQAEEVLKKFGLVD